MPSALLKDLCERYGIATDFQDVWGAVKRVDADSLVRILAAFDVDASTPASARRAWEAAETVRRSGTLPPVCAVQSTSAHWSLPVWLPESTLNVHWRIVLEEGREVEGEAIPTQTAAAEGVLREGVAYREKTIEIALVLPPGYHRFTLEAVPGETLVVCAPERCYRPEGAREGNRLWGPAIQLYSLRSTRNWGMGDLTDLRTSVISIAQRGASLVGVNPLHALYINRPTHASPYSPSSRRLLNVLYIDPEAVEGFDSCVAAKTLFDSVPFQARLAALRAEPLVNHGGVAAAKLEVLESLFDDFRRSLTADEWDDPNLTGHGFREFVRRGGESLRNHAVFEAMQESRTLAVADVEGASLSAGPASAEVHRFAALHWDRVLFHQYLQWLAHLQLQRVIDAGRAHGMAVGLYLDLAVSVDGNGSDAWAERDVFATAARVGAPADAFNPNGQDWGLLPMRSDRLRASRYRYFIETLRANMRDAGALRVDHVMGLMRLFWIPEGQTARSGSYVHYAVDEMLAIVALESQRNQCMVIGEDLGTVAPEIKAAMAQRDLLSYRLMYFERDVSGFIAPAAYPSSALVAVSTHDLATLTGWWSGEDLRVRLAQGLYPGPEIFERQLLDRSRERAELLLALRQAGLISHEAMGDYAFRALPPAELTEAVYAFLAATPCTLLVVQPEDWLGVVEQANMPSTTTEQPNWRRKLPLDLDEWVQSEGIAAMTRSLARWRPMPRAVPP